MNPAPPVTSMVISYSSFGQRKKVLAVFCHFQFLAQVSQLLAGDEAPAPGDLLDAGDVEALPVLHRLHKFRRLQHPLGRSGVQPGHAPAQQAHPQLAQLQVSVVHRGDLDLPPGGGLHPRSLSLHHSLSLSHNRNIRHHSHSIKLHNHNISNQPTSNPWVAVATSRRWTCS